MRERALVLGGGGSAGNAWLIGVIAGLCEAGVEVTEADLMIGTSAGSTAAAQISGAPPAELLAGTLAAPQAPAAPAGPGPGRGNGPGMSVADILEKTNRIINSAENAADMRRGMGTAALESDAASDSSVRARRRAVVAARLPRQDWPRRPLLIPAVDARTGEPVVFDRHSGVELADAVTASCAGSGVHGIGDDRYIDGGYRSNLNADLAAGYRRVLVLAPFGDKTRLPLEWGVHLAAQAEHLRAHGSRVETIFPDGDARDLFAIGANQMDPASRPPAARAGHEQGKSVAGRLAEFWG